MLSWLLPDRSDTIFRQLLGEPSHKVSYREVFHPDHYHGLELDPRQMVDEGLSIEENLGAAMG